MLTAQTSQHPGARVSPRAGKHVCLRVNVSVFSVRSVAEKIFHHEGHKEYEGMSVIHDDWGRTLSQRQTVNGTVCTRSYMWWYGDKLKRISSDFPGERQADYLYDGLGKRRVRSIDYPETYGDAEWTTWRWVGWSEYSEHDAGTDAATHWDLGTRRTTWIGNAKVDGADPSTGTWTCQMPDHPEKMRSIFEARQALRSNAGRAGTSRARDLFPVQGAPPHACNSSRPSWPRRSGHCAAPLICGHSPSSSCPHSR
jgi:hypothetical protein